MRSYDVHPRRNCASRGALPHHAGMRDRSSRKKLLKGAARHYAGDTLLDRIGRAVCAAECVPRKELYESWEVARRVRRRLRGTRLVDLACGHGLVAQIAAILYPEVHDVVAVDRRIPRSAETVAATMATTWPFLADRVRRVEADLATFPLERGDVVVSAHACGRLTDLVLQRAAAARAAVAVLPCCHNHLRLDAGGLEPWMEPDLAIDATRVLTLRARGYDVWTQVIPGDITPKNRLILGRPTDDASAAADDSGP